MSWSDASACWSWAMVATAIGMLALVVTAISTLRQLAVMRISVISLILGLIKLPFTGFDGVDSFAPSVDSGGDDTSSASWMQALWVVPVFLLARWFLKRIPEFALREEQEFREGCENWTTRERVNACLLFGAAHLNNLWYPLASAFALSVGGGIFMWCYLLEYRRSHDPERAARHAAALHALYNGIVVLIIASLLVIAICF